MRVFGIFVFSWIISILGFTYVNISDTFKHLELPFADYVYGNSFALCLSVSLLFLYSVIYKHEPNENSTVGNVQVNLRKLKLRTTLFFTFISLSNLSDEMFFNPYVTNWYEYVAAVILLTISTHVVNRIEKNRV